MEVQLAATTPATSDESHSPSALRSSDGCRPLAGLVKSVSSGQNIGHIIGCPKRLIDRQPPASVASFVVHQTPTRAPGRSIGCCSETSSTIASTVLPAKLLRAFSGRHADWSTGVPL